MAKADVEVVAPHVVGRTGERSDLEDDPLVRTSSSSGPKRGACDPSSEQNAAPPASSSQSLAVHAQRVPQRFVIVGVCFLATFSLYIDRTGFALVYTEVAKRQGLDEATKGLVLSAFYYGYAISQLPGGLLAAKFGGQKTLAVAFFGWGLLTMFIPVVSESVILVSLLRALIGVVQGIVIPSTHSILAQWVPIHERSRALSLTTSGMYLGSATAITVLPGLVARFGPSRILEGIGALGLLWLSCWLFTRTEPNSSERIVIASSCVEGHTQKSRNLAWTDMLWSLPVWAIITNSFCFHYALYMIMNWLPTYFDSIIKIPLSSLGNVKAMPFLLMFACSNVGGVLGDRMILGGISVARTRKTINTVGFVIAAAAQLGLAGAESMKAGIAVVTLTLAALGLARGGFSINHMDIAPGRAGILIGISNGAGTLAGIAGVSVTGFLLELGGGADHVEGWFSSAVLASLLCAVGAAFFLVHAQGVVIFK